MSSKEKYEWDERKSISNADKHGVEFSEIVAFDWNSALVMIDDRADYGENRFVALGLIGNRVHVCAYTERRDNFRLISLRKANRREATKFVESMK